MKSSDVNSSSSLNSQLTHAVKINKTSVVTTAMTAILTQFQATPPLASVKAVEEICVTCDGAHPYYQCLAADGNTFRDNIRDKYSAARLNTIQIPMTLHSLSRGRYERVEEEEDFKQDSKLAEYTIKVLLLVQKIKPTSLRIMWCTKGILFTLISLSFKNA
ncbi:hypothetical protein Tco_0585914 [Tanacetum coccineum]